MIRRNFLKAIASVLGLGVFTPVIKAAKTSKTIDVVPVKLVDGHYFYSYGRIVCRVDCKVRLGDNLFQNEDGKITNKPSTDKSGYSTFIGIAHTNSDEDNWCVAQLASRI